MVELLEAILIHLPPKDVLVVQRVSKAWQGTIKGSLLLQRALFYVPTQLDMVTVGTGPTHANLSTVTDDVSAHSLTTDIFAKDSCVLNPVLKTLIPPKSPQSAGDGTITHNRLQFFTLTAKASWKTMQLTQPRATRIALTKSYRQSSLCSCPLCVHRKNEHNAQMSNEHGLTIGDFVDDILKDGLIGPHFELDFYWT